MKLEKIEFRLDKYFINLQSINFEKDKHCFIGKNASGKSTLLRAIHSIFSRYKENRRNYFSIKDSGIYYTIPLGDEIMDLLNLDYEKNLTVKLSYNGYHPEFHCSWINKEYDYLKTKLVESYDTLIAQTTYIERNLSDFCKEKGLDKDQFFLPLIPLHQNAWTQQKLEDLERELKDGVIKEYYGFTELYELHTPDYLITRNGGPLPERFRFATQMFDQFKRVGEPTWQKYIREFEQVDERMLLDLVELVKKYNDYVKKINSLFSHYSQLFTKLRDNAIKNVFLLNHDSVWHPEKDIINTILKISKDVIYSEIIGYYTKNLEKKMGDYDFYHDLDKLGVMHLELKNISETEYDQSFLMNEKKYHIFIEDLSALKKRIARVIKNRDIVQDFDKGFKDFTYPLDDEYLYGIITEIVKDALNKYTVKTYDIVELYVNNEKDRNKYKFLLGEEKLELKDLSTGTVWGLRFELIKRLMTESDILLIDEPALFLHQNVQRKIAEEIANLNCKVLYTTHTAALIPLDFKEITLNEVRRDEDVMSIHLLESDIEDSIVEAFGYRYLKNIFVDYRKKVILFHTKQKDFEGHCKQSNVELDIPVLYGVIRVRSYSKIIELMSLYGIEVFTIVSKRKLVDELKECTEHGSIYHIGEFTKILRDNKNMKISSIFEKVGETY